MCVRQFAGANAIKTILPQYDCSKIMPKYFDALFEVLSEFSGGHICSCFHQGLGPFHIDMCKFAMQIHYVPKIMHQYLAVILRQSYYGKISFAVLVRQFPAFDKIFFEIDFFRFLHFNFNFPSAKIYDKNNLKRLADTWVV